MKASCCMVTLLVLVVGCQSRQISLQMSDRKLNSLEQRLHDLQTEQKRIGTSLSLKMDIMKAVHDIREAALNKTLLSIHRKLDTFQGPQLTTGEPVLEILHNMTTKYGNIDEDEESETELEEVENEVADGEEGDTEIDFSEEDENEEDESEEDDGGNGVSQEGEREENRSEGDESEEGEGEENGGEEIEIEDVTQASETDIGVTHGGTTKATEFPFYPCTASTCTSTSPTPAARSPTTTKRLSSKAVPTQTSPVTQTTVFRKVITPKVVAIQPITPRATTRVLPTTRTTSAKPRPTLLTPGPPPSTPHHPPSTPRPQPSTPRAPSPKSRVTPLSIPVTPLLTRAPPIKLPVTTKKQQPTQASTTPRQHIKVNHKTTPKPKKKNNDIKKILNQAFNAKGNVKIFIKKKPKKTIVIKKKPIKKPQKVFIRKKPKKKPKKKFFIRKKPIKKPNKKKQPKKKHQKKPQTINPKKTNKKLHATQSSMAKHGRGPHRAIDGITDWNHKKHHCSETAWWDKNPWWEVDFGGHKRVQEVKLWNRGDCCSKRMSKLTVKVDGQFCAYYAGPAPSGEKKQPAVVLRCKEQLYGRKLRITKKGQLLTLCEVTWA